VPRSVSTRERGRRQGERTSLGRVEWEISRERLRAAPELGREWLSGRKRSLEGLLAVVRLPLLGLARFGVHVLPSLSSLSAQLDTSLRDIIQQATAARTMVRTRAERGKKRKWANRRAVTASTRVYLKLRSRAPVFSLSHLIASALGLLNSPTHAESK
jgi:hypothetical protein